MKRNLLTILVLFLINVVLAAAVTAQDKVILETSPPPPAPARERVKTLGNAVWSYAPSKDESVISTRSLTLTDPNIRMGSISSSFTFKGKTVKAPDKITLSAFLASPERTYIDDLTFVIFDNDKILFRGNSQLSDGRTNGREVYSSVKFILSLEDFRKLAKAKKLTFKIGPTIFDVPETGEAAFGDLLKIIEEPS